MTRSVARGRVFCVLAAVSLMLSACGAQSLFRLPGTTTPPVSSSSFVSVCGMQLCLNGRAWRIHGATAYGMYDNPQAEVALAKAAGVNTIEIVEFETQYHSLADTTSEATWTRVDNLVAAAKQSGLHVLLNLSSYGQSLMAAGYKPTTTDWGPYLQFVVDRINTRTGVRYGDDPTIAKIELYGEIDAPNYDVPLRGTTAETTAFFSRTLRELKSLDTRHVISTGGFSYINDPGSGINWQSIVSDPNNATCDVEINSFGDRNVSVPNLSSYCAHLGKPWFLAAWSSCYNDNKWGSDDIDNWPTDAQMSAHAVDMYRVEHATVLQPPGPAVAAIGSDFWNLGPAANLGTCDIGQQFPQTFGAVETGN
ncbi:MAG: hypothetical protein JOZ99_02740 [Actinobacteria bacterium]|nr:hypothetical protein [Actinomycetota bacterium]